MGKFYSVQIPTSNTEEGIEEMINTASEFFNNLDGISSEAVDYEYNDTTYKTADILIDNTNIGLKFGIYLDNGQIRSLVNLVRGEITYVDNRTSQNYYEGPQFVVSAYIDEGCILLYIAIQMRASINGIELMYTKMSNNKTLFGQGSVPSPASSIAAILPNLLDISSLIFEDVEDSARIQYTYTNMFPYTAVSGSIDFLAQSYFVNNSIKHFTSNVMRECSTVTLGSTASLPDKNYLAIGAHCLVPLDNVVEEE